jgi:heme-degrading monooxygenase HmoA
LVAEADPSLREERVVYMSIRTYRVGTGSIENLMHRVDRDLAESFSQEPGFIAYQVVRTGDRAVASVTVFREREQAEASNDLAAQWVAEELADFDVERMGVIGGEVLVSRAVADMLEPAHA